MKYGYICLLQKMCVYEVMVPPDKRTCDMTFKCDGLIQKNLYEKYICACF